MRKRRPYRVFSTWENMHGTSMLLEGTFATPSTAINRAEELLRSVSFVRGSCTRVWITHADTGEVEYDSDTEGNGT